MMNKIFVLLFALILFSNPIAAQDAEETKILSGRDDSAKVVRLANYAYRFVDSDRQKATRLYDELMRLSVKLNYPYWSGMVWFNRGYMNGKAANDVEAIRNFDLAISYLSKTNRVDKVAYCHLNVGAIAGRLGKIDEKISRISKVIRLLENTKYQDILAGAYSGMGVLFFNLDEYDKGLVYFQRAAKTAEQAKDTAMLVEALYGMANCLSSQQKFPEALKNSDEAVRLASLRGDDYTLCVAHNSMAELYRKWGKADLSIAHAKQVLQYAVADDDVQYQLIGAMGLADGYRLAGNAHESILYYNKALQLGKEKAVVIQLDDIYKGMSEVYEQLNENGPALDYYKKYIAYRDSANNEKIRKNAAEMEVKFKTAEKEKELSENKLQLAQRDLQLQKSRNDLYLILGAFVLVSLIAIVLYLQSRYKKLSYARELQSMQQQKELQLLQALMQGEEKERARIAKDLHDGVAGMLAAVKMHLSSTESAAMLLQEEGYRQGMNLLNEATEEIRKTSHNLMPEVLLQHGLDVALSRYCDRVSNSRGLQIQYDSWGDIDRFTDSFELSVYRIVQELLNNIIKHSKATHGIVQVTQQDDMLSISIEDNGVGLVAGNGAPEGMGLLSLQSRVSAMNGKIDMKESEESGFAAYLEFEVSNIKKDIAV
jgi:signal transduction histidine kinase